VCGCALVLLVSAAARAAPGDSIPATASPYDALREAVRLVADRPFTGDFDAMVQRRAIRVAVTFNRTHYFIDKGRERRITYEVLKSFEKECGPDDGQPQAAPGDRADVERLASERIGRETVTYVSTLRLDPHWFAPWQVFMAEAHIVEPLMRGAQNYNFRVLARRPRPPRGPSPSPQPATALPVSLCKRLPFEEVCR
jgi:hypothetical protein